MPSDPTRRFFIIGAEWSGRCCHCAAPHKRSRALASCQTDAKKVFSAYGDCFIADSTESINIDSEFIVRKKDCTMHSMVVASNNRNRLNRVQLSRGIPNTISPKSRNPGCVIFLANIWIPTWKLKIPWFYLFLHHDSLHFNVKLCDTHVKMTQAGLHHTRLRKPACAKSHYGILFRCPLITRHQLLRMTLLKFATADDCYCLLVELFLNMHCWLLN